MADKILIIGPSWVGDMVMAQGLFKLLKQQNEKVILHVLAPEWTFSLLSRMPEVDQAIPMPIGHGKFNLRARYQLAQQLKKKGYDQAIIMPNSWKSALIPWLAGIPIRTGWRGEWRYGLLNDVRVLNKKHYPLMIEQFIALGLPAKATLPTQYPLPTFSIAASSLEQTLKKHSALKTDKKVLALCPGAAFGSAKRWPENYFAQVANEKIAEGWDVWLFGSSKDQAITEKIMALTESRCKNVTADLAETIDLFNLVTGVISNDSGLMHVASALNKPLIAIYGPTSPGFTPPLSTHAAVLQLNLSCQPCFKRECPLKHHRCMQEITPQQVCSIISTWRN